MTALSAVPDARARRWPKPTLLIGLALLAALIVAALFPAALAPHSPTDFDYGAILQAPTARHPFGTDNFGRDVLSRVVHGTRTDQIGRAHV